MVFPPVLGKATHSGLGHAGLAKPKETQPLHQHISVLSASLFKLAEGCRRGRQSQHVLPDLPGARQGFPSPRSPGRAQLPLQEQTLLPQVPARVETETVATAGAGTSRYMGTPGDRDTSASRMTTLNGLGATARALPATRKHPSSYQRPLRLCQAASAASHFTKAEGRGK